MKNIKKIIIFSFIALATSVSASNFNTVKVNADVLNVRASDNIDSKIIGKSIKDSVLYTVGESDNWFKIDFGKNTGWVSKDYLDILSESVPVNVNASVLNMRESPDKDGNLLMKLTEGTDLEILDKSGDWYEVEHNGVTGYVFEKYVSISDEGVIPSKLPREDIAAVIEFAKEKLGSEYVWGANGPTQFDCSGYVKYVFENTIGVELPRTSYLQSRLDNKLDFSELETGDLVFFDTSKQGRVNHVGIYLGDGKFIHASSARSKKRVTISDLSKFYKNAFKWGVRI